MRVLKWLGVVVATLVVLIAVAAGVIYAITSARMGKKFAVTVTAPPIPSGAAALAEGKRLFVTRGCTDCHGADGAGMVVVDDPVVGRLAGANLTSGKGGVGGQRSDADLVKAVRHGLKPDGSPLIFMPSFDYATTSDGDMGVLIAYIRSLTAVDKPTVAPKPGPLARVLYLAGQMPLYLPAELIDHSVKPSTVPPAVTVEYGKYLAAGCTGCHGFTFSGGPIPGAPPEWLPASNITPHPTTGLGKWWDEADFIRAVREGKRPDGSVVRPPMPWLSFSQLTDTEVKAMWAYLKTVPAKEYGGR